MPFATKLFPIAFPTQSILRLISSSVTGQLKKKLQFVGDFNFYEIRFFDCLSYVALVLNNYYLPEKIPKIG